MLSHKICGGFANPHTAGLRQKSDISRIYSSRMAKKCPTYAGSQNGGFANPHKPKIRFCEPYFRGLEDFWSRSSKYGKPHTTAETAQGEGASRERAPHPPRRHVSKSAALPPKTHKSWVGRSCTCPGRVWNVPGPKIAASRGMRRCSPPQGPDAVAAACARASTARGMGASKVLKR